MTIFLFLAFVIILFYPEAPKNVQVDTKKCKLHDWKEVENGHGGYYLRCMTCFKIPGDDWSETEED